MASEQRVMRTYRVEVFDHEDGSVVRSDDVNLSYRLDAGLNPVTDDGKPVGDAFAAVELQRRLRKLTRARRIAVTAADLDHLPWDTRLVRQRFVQVEVDDLGRAVKPAR